LLTDTVLRSSEMLAILVGVALIGLGEYNLYLQRFLLF
jgi:hypothetical protein